MDARLHPHRYLSLSSAVFWEDKIIQIDPYLDSLIELRSGLLNISETSYKQNIICNYTTASLATGVH